MLDNPNRNQKSGQRNGGAQVLDATALFNGFDPSSAFKQFWSNPGLKIGQEITESWLKFLGNRWAKDLAFQQLVVQCRTPEDFGAVTSEFLQQAASDYSAEFNEIANAAWTAGRASLSLTDDSCGSKGCGSCGNKHAAS